MKTIDVKSLVIGILLCAVAFLLLLITMESLLPGFSIGNSNGRFQLTNMGLPKFHARYVIDTRTGMIKGTWANCIFKETDKLRFPCYEFGSEFHSKDVNLQRLPDDSNKGGEKKSDN